MSVWHLAEGRIHEEPFHILEMASSPGGKTTQLAEHYPNSFIVANEFTKDRMNALLENIERMGVSNIAVTNMNGVQYRDVPEAFDFVLLDAPCSGEGIGFKAEESLRYWNIKNVRTIARLQSKLLLAGLAALKPGGTLLYSTCTLNTIENEGVLETAKALYGDLISISFAKRFWPHKEVAGGFYVAKIQKRGSLPTDTQKESSGEIRSIMNMDIAPLRDKELRQIQEVIEAFPLLEKNGQLYRYKNDVLYIRHT
jgi:16S rRNA (cytosine1407-C5)-methyltransferase